MRLLAIQIRLDGTDGSRLNSSRRAPEVKLKLATFQLQDHLFNSETQSSHINKSEFVLLPSQQIQCALFKKRRD